MGLYSPNCVGTGFLDIALQPLHPTVCVRWGSGQARIRANFGQRPFLYNSRSMLSSEPISPMETVDRSKRKRSWKYLKESVENGLLTIDRQNIAEESG